MNLSVRTAEKRDVSKILEIVNYEIKNSTVIYDYEERTYDYQLDWYETKRRDDMPVLVAEKDEEVLGFGTFGIFRPWAAYKHSAEHSIYIHKDSRGLGIGKILMTELINAAEEKGFHTMIAGVDSSNESSIEFHKKFGFKEIGQFKEVGYKFDRWLDLTFLQLLL
ncbi:GNAT family N-acetyltransferase [Fulvivirga sediminis]|uniref:N-acetyltransferase n=1 Tax=Fulvivirga sediminis TaxID=2803949 RepID=A0A937K128_9BACT|nr:GNAT family N-acetyltransferase [Fulvivirga sediminis]MBL3658943.1 N-acetyltransferase [Fulvivirga sediminis]